MRLVAAIEGGGSEPRAGSCGVIEAAGAGGEVVQRPGLLPRQARSEDRVRVGAHAPGRDRGIDTPIGLEMREPRVWSVREAEALRGVRGQIMRLVAANEAGKAGKP